MRAAISSHRRLTVASIVGVCAVALLAGYACTRSGSPHRAVALAPPPTASTAVGATVLTDPGLPVPAPLTYFGLGLRAAPVPVPLELEIPRIGVKTSVLGVGMTAKDAMDAPEGRAADPVWQQAFWYRGSAIPGAKSTALIAGHIDDPLGRDGVFGHIDQLQPGDQIIVHDTRSGLDVRFAVTEAKTYSLAEAADPAVLTRMYGTGPVAGAWPEPSADGLAHLTLVTCAGTFRNGTHDHRLAVYATRVA
ncbi:MAG: peptidase sortase [Actinomycetia bacterium]|nr:peptidase sortase [Actinomycetes bacterium]